MGASHARESGVHHGRGPFPPKRASKACSVNAGDLPLTLKAQLTLGPLAPGAHRSEERRVGKEWRARWSPDASERTHEEVRGEEALPARYTNGQRGQDVRQ